MNRLDHLKSKLVEAEDQWDGYPIWHKDDLAELAVLVGKVLSIAAAEMKIDTADAKELEGFIDHVKNIIVRDKTKLAAAIKKSGAKASVAKARKAISTGDSRNNPNKGAPWE